MRLIAMYNTGEEKIKIKLPASDTELVDFINQLPNNEPIQLFEVEMLDYYDTFLEVSFHLNEIDFVHICQWNQFAEEVEKFDDFELMSFECLLEKTNFSDNATVDNLINLARNTLNETYVFAPCRNEVELFDYYKDSDIIKDVIPSLKNLDDDSMELLDAQIVGEKIKNYENGSFIGNVYIATDDHLVDMYDGNYPKIEVNENGFNSKFSEMNM